MRTKILFVAGCLLSVLSLFSQEKVTIDMGGEKWYAVNDIEKKTITLDKAPKELTILFPNENFQNYQLQFSASPAKEKISVAFNCKDTACISLSLSDFTNQKIVLKINQGTLVGIGARATEPKKNYRRERENNNHYRWPCKTNFRIKTGASRNSCRLCRPMPGY